MLEFRPLTIAFVLVALLCGKAQATSPEAATDQVKAQLIASVDAVHPGDEILVGVHQRIIPHWHTYWINPGDSGLPTTIDYALPGGSTVGDIQWPTPIRIILGPVTNYGYENEVTLISSIKVPLDSIIGAQFPVNAKVKWLVCEEICIPQKVDLTLILPIVSPISRTFPLIPSSLRMPEYSMPKRPKTQRTRTTDWRGVSDRSLWTTMMPSKRF